MKNKFLIAIMAITTAFCCLFGFTACNDESENEPLSAPKAELTEDTDFSALISDKVTQSEWEAAFSEDCFSNATIKHFNEYYERTTYIKIWTGDTDKYVYTDTEQENEGKIIGYYTIENGNKYGYMLSDGILIRGDMSDMREDFDTWCMSFTMLCPTFKDFYSEFAYDDTVSAYVYKGAGISTNSPMEGGKMSFTDINVKFSDGKLACIICDRVDYDDGIYEFYMYDYGKTTVTLPEDYIEI